MINKRFASKYMVLEICISVDRTGAEFDTVPNNYNKEFK